MAPPAKQAEPFFNPTTIDLSLPRAYPANLGPSAPTTTARGIYIIDADSMIPIYTKNPDESLRPASTTKIMTALVTMDKFGSSDELASTKSNQAIGKTIHLESGAVFTFSDLLYGLLLESGNDVALALAENYSGGYSAMIDDMNEKAKKLGMNQTNYRNVSGIDQFGHQTTPRDMAILAAEAMKIPEFRNIVGTKEKNIISLDGKITHKLANTNELLGAIDGVAGIKTGWTTLAQECLIAYVERDGHRIIFVVLGSQDRFGETKQLIDWVFSNHLWRNVIL